MLQKIREFISYLLGKSDELKDLEPKDALLAKTVLDIHRKRTHSEMVYVPLFALKQIHAIDREGAIHSTRQRAARLGEAKEILLARGDLSRELLDQYIPSVSGIKVVRESETSCIAFEGNGRLVALQRVFIPGDSIRVEVEEYTFRNQAKILRRMRRVQRLNGLC